MFKPTQKENVESKTNSKPGFLVKVQNDQRQQEEKKKKENPSPKKGGGGGGEGLKLIEACFPYISVRQKRSPF
jgi:hypothetical protein